MRWAAVQHTVILVASTACVLPSARRTTTDAPGSTGPDGLTIAVVTEPPAARQVAVRALQANGFAIDGGASSTSTVRTRARAIGADTSLVVSALITPADLPPTRSMITLSATVSVPSAGIRNAQLVWRVEDAGGPWRFLEAVRDSVRKASGPPP
jgi:hypothetical protein